MWQRIRANILAAYAGRPWRRSAFDFPEFFPSCPKDDAATYGAAAPVPAPRSIDSERPSKWRGSIWPSPLLLEPRMRIPGPSSPTVTLEPAEGGKPVPMVVEVPVRFSRIELLGHMRNAMLEAARQARAEGRSKARSICERELRRINREILAIGRDG